VTGQAAADGLRPRGPEPVRGSRVLLRPVTPADAPVLDLWASDRSLYQGEFNDLGVPTRTGADATTQPAVTDSGGLLMVARLADATPIGTVSWHSVSYGPNPESRAWNFGIALIPEARGHGYGVEAQRLLVEYLFASTDVNRVEASTDVENVAEQRALEKAGLRREGVLRGAQFRAGAYRDMVVYSRLRDDR
jgi:RimJ/RimL family protein N-acetyltransferase